MVEAITSTVLATVAARPLWGAARIAGRGGYPVTLHPGPPGFTVFEAVAADRTLALSLEVENAADDLPRPVALEGKDLAILKRRNAGADRIQIELTADDDGPLLALRPLQPDGSQGRGIVVVEPDPLRRLSLAPLPGPFHTPGTPLPDPVLLDVRRLARLLQALEDADVCRKVELVLLADHGALGAAFRPWSDTVAGSAQIARCWPVARGNHRDVKQG